ncbi:MAG: hypothetical protein V1772_00555 [Chloroflexota bacterium]
MKLRTMLWLALVLALAAGLLVGCSKGPEAEIKNLRVLVTHLFPDTTSFRGLAFDGKEYDFFITEKTVIKSDTDQVYTYKDIILGDELDLWLNKIPKSPEPDPLQYDAVQVKIAPTTR